VFKKVYEEKVEANPEVQHLFIRILNYCPLEMTTRKVNYLIIQCSRVSKSLRKKNFNERLLSTSHIIQN